MANKIQISVVLQDEFADAFNAYMTHLGEDTNKSVVIRSILADAIGFDESAILARKEAERIAKEQAIATRKQFREATKNLSPDEMAKLLESLNK